MSEDKVTISLEEFCGYLIKKWKMVLVIVIVSIVLFAGGAKAFGNEITVPHSEEYLHYEQELAWHESYLEESILMNLDPTCIFNRSLYLRNISDAELLRDYIVSVKIWDELETERSKTYISELLVWGMDAETKTATVRLRHGTSEECLEWIEYLKEKIVEFDPNIEVIIGEEEITKDEELQEEHLRWYSRIDYVNSLLLDSQAGYTIKVHPVAAILTGAIAGMILSLFTGLILYYKRKK